ncbi:MAG: exodeoxyribonuclease VII small subunit [Chitinophagales bacterium]|nr:exodeoxyribonuclease VII small subunit [Chitinophagales bacterium]
MKKDLTYSEAFSKLEQLVGELEDGNIQLEKLAAKAQQANELISICENKLRKIEGDVNKNLPVNE